MSENRKVLSGKLIVASHNAGKVTEINELVRAFGIETISAADLDLPEPEETGDTFIANAELKALAAAQAYPRALGKCGARMLPPFPRRRRLCQWGRLALRVLHLRLMCRSLRSDAVRPKCTHASSSLTRGVIFMAGVGTFARLQ